MCVWSDCVSRIQTHRRRQMPEGSKRQKVVRQMMFMRDRQSKPEAFLLAHHTKHVIQTNDHHRTALQTIKSMTTFEDWMTFKGGGSRFY